MADKKDKLNDQAEKIRQKLDQLKKTKNILDSSNKELSLENKLREEEKEQEKIIVEQQQKENSKRYNEIKSKFKKYGAIMYQDEYCAIVKKTDDIIFIKAFSDLTRDGYRMMAQDEGGSFNLGIVSVGAGSYYFFQKVEYITPNQTQKIMKK